MLQSTSEVESVDFNSFGNLLVTGSQDGIIRLWDVEQGSEIGVFEQSDANYVSFNPDGNLIASGGTRDTIIWDTNSQTEIVRFDHGGFYPALAFSPNGKMLAVCGYLEVKLWDVGDQTELATLEGYSNDIEGVAFSSNGSLLASAGRALANIRLWDIDNRIEIAKAETEYGNVHSVEFNAEGTILATTGNSNPRFWNVDSLSEITAIWMHPDSPFSGVLNHDFSILASGNWDGAVKLWDVDTQTEMANLGSHPSIVSSLAFSPNGDMLASGSHDDTSVKLWDINSQDEIASIEKSVGVSSLTFSPDNNILASGSQDDTILLWDMNPYTGTYISVKIDNFSPSYSEDPVEVEIGGEVELFISFTSMSNVVWPFSVTTSVMAPDGSKVIYKESQDIALQPGEQRTCNWNYTVEKIGNHNTTTMVSGWNESS